jgi:DNA-binding IscR family transcriptional regulator
MEEMTIYDVVQAMGELPRIRECPLGLPEHVTLCPLHARLDEAIELVEKAFRATTIAELVAVAPPLCRAIHA